MKIIESFLETPFTTQLLTEKTEALLLNFDGHFCQAKLMIHISSKLFCFIRSFLMSPNETDQSNISENNSGVRQLDVQINALR